VPTDLPERKQAPAGRPPDPRAFERRFLVGFVLLLFGLLVAEVVRDYSPVKLSVLFFLGAWFPRVLIHECGHALAARLCGWRVHGIMIGRGQPLFRFRVRGVPLVIGRMPLGGFVQSAPTHLRQVRLRSAFVYFMGPGAELITLALVALLVGPHRLLSATSDLRVIAVQAAAAAVALGIFTNLLPHRVRVLDDLASPGVPSDGLGILLSFRWPRSVFERQLRADERERG
jgi:hypothetical protein